MDRRLALTAVGAVGAVLLLAWLVLLRPTSYEWGDGRIDDGPETDGLPWNTLVRDPVYWEHNGTSGVLGACSHGSCPVSLRTDDRPDTAWGGVLYWRPPWASDGSVATTIPTEVQAEHRPFDSDEVPETVDHRVSVATYHARDPAFDLGVVLLAVVALRLGVGDGRARSAAVWWGAMVPLAPFVAPFQYTILTPVFPSLFLAAVALGVRWTWQRPRVRRATSGMLEAAVVLLVLGVAMMQYFTAAPLA